MRKKTRQLLAAGMAFVMTWSSFGMTAPVYAETVGTGQTEEALKASDSNAEDSRARNVASDADAGKAPEESVVPETKTAQKEQIALFAGGIIEGTGTVSDPYLIADADDWKAVMSKENQTYNRYGNLQGHIALSSDIDLSGETWDAENLNGKTFDGRGHKISGIGQPLFETVNGTVKNLVISGVSIEETNAGTPVGAIAGKTSKTVNIQNCYVRGKLSNTSYAVGGLVGDVSGGTTSVEIKNCKIPPSTYRICPFTKSEASEAKNTAGPPRSEASPQRPAGVQGHYPARPQGGICAGVAAGAPTVPADGGLCGLCAGLFAGGYDPLPALPYPGGGVCPARKYREPVKEMTG